jgi:hypothetical protein
VRRRPGDFNFVTGAQDFSRGAFQYYVNFGKFVWNEAGAYLETPFWVGVFFTAREGWGVIVEQNNDIQKSK